MGADPYLLNELHSFLVLNDQKQCTLLGNSFGIMVQGVLGLVAFLGLIVKRFLEPEKSRRSWTTWGADSSKQVLGALLVHFLNMGLSAGFVSSVHTNECLFYLVNFVIDCVGGLVLNIFFLRLFDYTAMRCSSSADSASASSASTMGDYGDPFSWSRWFGQLGLWLGANVAAKAVLLCAVVLPLKGPMYRVVDALFLPLERYPKLELLLIMVVIPLVLNVITFWVQDHFLMKELDDTTNADGALWAKDNFDTEDEHVARDIEAVHAATLASAAHQDPHVASGLAASAGSPTQPSLSSLPPGLGFRIAH